MGQVDWFLEKAIASPQASMESIFPLSVADHIPYHPALYYRLLRPVTQGREYLCYLAAHMDQHWTSYVSAFNLIMESSASLFGL